MSHLIPALIWRPGTVTALAIAVLLAACTDSTGPADRSTDVADPQMTAEGGTSARHMMDHITLNTSLRPPAIQPRYPAGRGYGEWSREVNHRELHMTARYLPPGLRVNFYVGGTRIGSTKTVNSYGRVALHADTRHGQYVPSSCRGQAVVVKTTSGIVAVRGEFPN